MLVSVIILTFNEAANLPRCFDALSWCDDIIVVDSGSTDRTREIAKENGARVLLRPFDNFASQRNFGLEQGTPRHEWVLHLDADEVVTPAFRERLAELRPLANIDAYRVPSKLMMDESWLKYAGMYPTYQVRLGHRGRLRFVQVGHGQREDLPPSRVADFDEPYLHYNFSQGLAAWFRKHIRYAEDEARLLVAIRSERSSVSGRLLSTGKAERRRRLKEFSAYVPLVLRPIARILYVFVWRRGFLDGRHGLLYALMLSVYEGMVAVFALDEKRRRSGSRKHEVGRAAIREIESARKD